MIENARKTVVPLVQRLINPFMTYFSKRERYLMLAETGVWEKLLVYECQSETERTVQTLGELLKYV